MKYIKVVHKSRRGLCSIWECKDFRYGVKCVHSTDAFYHVGTEDKPYSVWRGKSPVREEHEITKDEAFLEMI